ncbi:MAG: hypothetical protein ACRDJH_07385, partial [Thermomicrobiales bacterium]
VHFVRGGDETAGEQSVVTSLPRDLPHSPLGVTLRHPLAPAAEVPIAWPSSIRQPVRNDYPLLACLELGVRRLRVPASDVTNQGQRQRLTLLRDEGVQITATWIWSDRLDLCEEVAHHRDLLAGFEVQVPGHPLPDEACLRAIQRCTTATNLPVTLAVLMPREAVSGKQHPRTRVGYRTTELPALNDHLAGGGVRIDRVLCRVDADSSPWESMDLGLELPALSQVGAIDWAVEFTKPDEDDQVIRAAEAMMAAARCPGSRLYLEPLVDLDRTMDTPYGLLDRLSNPRPVFRAVRCLNTMLFGLSEPWQPVDVPAIEGARSRCLRGSSTTLWLLLPERDQHQRASVALRHVRQVVPGAAAARCVCLASATSRRLTLDDDEGTNLSGPTLLVFDS